MRSVASIKGHPVHPMLVVVPIGMFVWALVGDIVFLTTGNLFWYDLSLWTGIAAVATALPAAIPGFVDYFSLPLGGRVEAKATIHMALNLSIVALYTVAAWLMWDRGATTGAALASIVALHGVGAAMLLVSGWLGGELAYRHRIGVLSEVDEYAEDRLTVPSDHEDNPP